VREAAYDLLLILCKSHPLVGVESPSPGGTDGERETAGAAQAVRVKKMMCSLLLKGLTDPDSEGMDGDGQEDTEEEVEDAMELDLPDEDAERSGDQGPSMGSGNKARVGIRRRVFDFFNDQFGLSGDPYVRLNVLMTKLFEPSRTDCWLHYSTYLMISLSTGSGEQYSKPLFPHQLMADCSFTPMYLSAGRQGQGYRQGQGVGGSYDSSSLPLFSLERTQSSQSQAQYDSNTGLFGTQSKDYGPRRAGFIRGTQEVSWMQTQYPTAPGGTVPVGGPGSKQEFQFRNPLSTQSLFTPGVAPPKGTAGTQSGGHRGRLGGSQAAGSGSGLMGPPSGLPSYFVGREVSTVTQRVPRRFKSKVYSSSFSSKVSGDTQADGAGDHKKQSSSSSSGFYGALAARAAKKAADDRLKRTAKVVVYRSYKVGELPDICIPLCDLLKPLQGLCLRDPKAASTIFSSMFDALYLSVPLSSPEATAMRINLNDLVRTANSQSTHFAATMLSSCLQCLEVEDPRHTRNKGARPQGQGLLSFTPVEAVAEAALKSLNFHAGIQYLEGLLLVTARIKKCPVPKAAGGKKGRRGSAPAEEMQIVGAEELPEVRDERIVWRQLSVLYSALGENDILLGLAERVGAYPRQTRRAIDAEVCGDYRKAVLLYGELFDLARKRYRGSKGRHHLCELCHKT
jgi:hypothetical protein